MPRTPAITPGGRYHRWTVIGPARERPGLAEWVRCRCECGTDRDVAYRAVRSGKSKSCGCLGREKHFKHGESVPGKKTSEYQIWCQLKARCSNPQDARYADYGGRGVKVCPQWRESYDCFLADMGRRPSAKHSIDRIDNDGDYEPGNCRWATPAVQTRNTRKNHFLTINGETLTLSDWAIRAGVTYNTLNGRLIRGWTPEEAVSGQLKLFTPGRWGWRVKK